MPLGQNQPNQRSTANVCSREKPRSNFLIILRLLSSDFPNLRKKGNPSEKPWTQLNLRPCPHKCLPKLDEEMPLGQNQPNQGSTANVCSREKPRSNFLIILRLLSSDFPNLRKKGNPSEKPWTQLDLRPCPHKWLARLDEQMPLGQNQANQGSNANVCSRKKPRSNFLIILRLLSSDFPNLRKRGNPSEKPWTQLNLRPFPHKWLPKVNE
jgi:hypothetical protein